MLSDIIIGGGTLLFSIVNIFNSKTWTRIWLVVTQ